jgi:hypothetical protein
LALRKKLKRKWLEYNGLRNSARAGDDSGLTIPIILSYNMGVDMRRLGKRGEAPRVVLRLPGPMVAQLEKLAGSKHGAFSAYIRAVLEKHLARKK